MDEIAYWQGRKLTKSDRATKAFDLVNRAYGDKTPIFSK